MKNYIKYLIMIMVFFGQSYTAVAMQGRVVIGEGPVDDYYDRRYYYGPYPHDGIVIVYDNGIPRRRWMSRERWESYHRERRLAPHPRPQGIAPHVKK